MKMIDIEFKLDWEGRRVVVAVVDSVTSAGIYFHGIHTGSTDEQIDSALNYILTHFVHEGDREDGTISLQDLKRYFHLVKNQATSAATYSNLRRLMKGAA